MKLHTTNRCLCNVDNQTSSLVMDLKVSLHKIRIAKRMEIIRKESIKDPLITLEKYASETQLILSQVVSLTNMVDFHLSGIEKGILVRF